MPSAPLTVEEVTRFCLANMGREFRTAAQGRRFRLSPARNGIRFDLPSGSYFPINPRLLQSYLDAFNAWREHRFMRPSDFPRHLRETSYVAKILPEVKNSRESSAFANDLAEIQRAKATDRQALLLARIGQGQFRDDLLERDGRCFVTRIDDVRVLRASHIKPWSECTDFERLDPNNGLLLSPAYDQLFDRHLISFTDRATLLVSKTLSAALLQQLGVDRSATGLGFQAEALSYLRHHRKQFEDQERGAR